MQFLKLQIRKVEIKFEFKWYDLWIGGYWDKKNRVFYICLLPTLVLSFRKKSIKMKKCVKVIK